jgi:hypothetical protein
MASPHFVMIAPTPDLHTLPRPSHAPTALTHSNGPHMFQRPYLPQQPSHTVTSLHMYPRSFANANAIVIVLNICVTPWLGGFRLFMDLGFILYYSHVYKGVSSHLYKTALINPVYHTTFHYSTHCHFVTCYAGMYITSSGLLSFRANVLISIDIHVDLLPCDVGPFLDQHGMIIHNSFA